MQEQIARWTEGPHTPIVEVRSAVRRFRAAPLNRCQPILIIRKEIDKLLAQVLWEIFEALTEPPDQLRRKIIIIDTVNTLFHVDGRRLTRLLIERLLQVRQYFPEFSTFAIMLVGFLCSPAGKYIRALLLCRIPFLFNEMINPADRQFREPPLIAQRRDDPGGTYSAGPGPLSSAGAQAPGAVRAVAFRGRADFQRDTRPVERGEIVTGERAWLLALLPWKIVHVWADHPVLAVVLVNFWNASIRPMYDRVRFT